MQAASLLRFRSVPIIQDYAQWCLFPPGKEEFLTSEHAALKRQHVFERMLLKVLARLLGGHPGKQVLDLLQRGRLREGSAANGRKHLGAPVIVRDSDHRLQTRKY